MARYNIEGFCAPPLTPFDDQGRVDLSVIPAYAKWLREQGIEHVYVAGTSGEGPSLTLDERKQLAEAWLRQTQSGIIKTAVIHIGAGNIMYERELAAHAERHGAHAIACVPPYYYRPGNVNELADYFVQVAGAAPKTPFLYYHFPDVTNVHLPLPDIFDALSTKVPTFSGCKFTSYKMDEAAEIQRCYPDLLVMPGRDESLALGMKGAWVTASANWHGKRLNDLVHAFREGNLDEARRLQTSVATPFYTAHRLKVNLFSAFRAWLEHISSNTVQVGKPRLPIPALTDMQRSMLLGEF